MSSHHALVPAMPDHEASHRSGDIPVAAISDLGRQGCRPSGPFTDRGDRILVLDLDPASGLGRTLLSLLDEAASPAARQFTTSYHAASGMERPSLNQAVFGSKLVVLILPAQHSLEIETVFLALRRDDRSRPILVVAPDHEPERLLELLKLGASDFLIPPLRGIELLPRVEWLVEHHYAPDPQVESLKERLGLKHIVGQSEVLLAEIRKLPLLARSEATILVSGETGTGKEICARSIHYLSPRAERSFVPMNCGAIPAELVENELFGHERGAYTTADTRQAGLLQEVDGGTLFLDEVDSLPLAAQVKLLRFLQTKEFRPLGAGKSRQVNVRVIAATNIVIEDAVRSGAFRRDLYYRLNVLPLKLPPLRDRREDIPLLARHVLEKRAIESAQPVKDLAPDALHKLLLYDWPGNVRELENVLERAVVLAEQTLIRATDISLLDSGPAPGQESFRQLKAQAVAEFEKRYLQDLLLAFNGNITRAAQAAQKNRRAFFELMRKHRLTAQAGASAA